MGSINTLAVYLTQWLKVASGNRVALSQHGSFGQKSFYVFKCNICKDNWHVGTENFPNATSVPEVLSDWVKKHRHVCTQYVNSNSGISGPCVKCDWPYGAHEESWEDTVLPDGQTVGNLLAKERQNWAVKPKPNTVDIPKGRLFRDSD